jgi:hypothetical protein
MRAGTAFPRSGWTRFTPIAMAVAAAVAPAWAAEPAPSPALTSPKPAASIPSSPTQASPTLASPSPASTAPIQTLDRAQLEQLRLQELLRKQPKAYVDKVLDSTTSAAADDENAPTIAEQSQGFRSVFVETRMGVTSTEADGLALRRSNELGVRTEARLETLNYGEFVLQADTRQRSNSQLPSALLVTEPATGARLTVRNTQFPLTTQIFADSVVGDFSSDVTDALARSYRLSLGRSALRGLGSRIYSKDWDVRVGTGQRGRLIGGPYPGFQQTEGQLSWLGASRRVGAGGVVGLQASQARGVLVPQDGSAIAAQGSTEDITSLAAAAAYAGVWNANDTWRTRLSYIRSQATPSVGQGATPAQAWYGEAGFKLGRYQHELGVYQSDFGLRFGDSRLPDDQRGAYWRVDSSGLQWSWGAGADYEQQNPSQDAARLSSRRIQMSGNGHWRIDRDSSVGGQVSSANTLYIANVSFPNIGDSARSVSAGVYYQNRWPQWGRSRISYNLRRSAVDGSTSNTSNELLWEHDWVTGKYDTQRPELATSLGWARESSAGVNQSYPSAGLVLRHYIDADWSVSGNLRYSLRYGNEATTKGWSGSIDTERGFGSGWRAGASLLLNQSSQSLNASASAAAQNTRSQDTAVFVYLRWDHSAGLPYQAAGLRSADSAGTGSIDGAVFFDANRDNEQQSNEAGVAGVEVILDGRYRITTDKNGRFEFPVVTTGRHQLTVYPESIPLPWGTANQEPKNIDVPLRANVQSRIAVTQIGD